MGQDKKIDWHTEKKEIPVGEWSKKFNWVEEFNVSPDGENIAAIVNIDEAEFSVCVNGETWEENFEKAWCLKYGPAGKLATLVSIDEEWTICVDGVLWDSRFDYIWDLIISSDGKHIGCAIQNDSMYGMVVNDQPWEKLYDNISGVALSDQGSSAAVVQIKAIGQADIEGFNEGVFSVAYNGIAQPEKYMNIWNISFDETGKQVAYTIRKNRFDYSISRNSNPWSNSFQCSWKPEFLNNSVIAPVRQDGKWFLYKDENPFWDNKYVQLWKIAAHGESQNVAAVVSNKFGKWGVAENDKILDFSCDSIISDLYYSSTGKSLIAVFKNHGSWDVAVNGKPWDVKADKLWRPVVSDNDKTVAARIEKDGGYYLVVNGKVYDERFDMVFDPKVSPEGDKILLKTINNGIYKREILELDKVF